MRKRDWIFKFKMSIIGMFAVAIEGKLSVSSATLNK
jgi:hypothetical protein